MKKLILILLLVVASTAVQAQVHFEVKSTDALQEMAIKSNKLVFIDLYASWCPPCRTMEAQVFSRKDVGEFMNSRFVCAKFDTDKALGADLLRRYSPSGSVPTYLIFDTKGNLLGRIVGGSSAEEFVAGIKEILAKKKE